VNAILAQVEGKGVVAHESKLKFGKDSNPVQGDDFEMDYRAVMDSLNFASQSSFFNVPGRFPPKTKAEKYFAPASDPSYIEEYNSAEEVSDDDEPSTDGSILSSSLKTELLRCRKNLLELKNRTHGREPYPSASSMHKLIQPETYGKEETRGKAMKGKSYTDILAAQLGNFGTWAHGLPKVKSPTGQKYGKKLGTPRSKSTAASAHKVSDPGLCIISYF
jgi:hypothetical protein